jgi:exopolysaccharide biosynthesis polyprenyl glycosylphosphotransferase
MAEPAPLTAKPTLADVTIGTTDAGSTPRRLGHLHGWMVSLPLDVVAMLLPLLWMDDHWRGTIFTAGLTVGILSAGGLYRSRRHLSFLDELPSVLGRVLTSAAIVAVIFAIRHNPATYLGEFMRTVAVAGALLLVSRAASRWLINMARGRRWVEHGAVIVGGGPVATELARLLRAYPRYGLRVAGFIDDESSQHQTQDLMPWIGAVEEAAEELEAMIASTHAKVIIIADAPALSEDRLVELVRRPVAMACDLLVVPRLHDFSTQGSPADHIGAIPVMRIKRPTLTGPKWALKRSTDVVVAAVALILVSPIVALCAIAVRLEGGPGVLFRQERVGRHGRRFQLIKFRSMRPVDETESQTTWSVANDARVGPVGRFMRRTSLDELPQLWNVLRGDMTFVGPRPERPYFSERFAAEHPLYGSRNRVPAGLTGLAQVSGLRGDTPISDRARFDNYYIENWSLWLDTKVLLRTFGEVLRGGGR